MKSQPRQMLLNIGKKYSTIPPDFYRSREQGAEADHRHLGQEDRPGA
jgi:hypothetical protein